MSGKWVWGLLHGDFGYSSAEAAGGRLIWERVALTMAVSFAAMLFLGGRAPHRHLFGGAPIFDQ